MRLIVPLFLFAFAALFSDGAVKETVESTHAVDPGATFGLENINGNVTIDTWDRPEIRIVALKKAKTQEALDVMKVKVHATPGRVEVKTNYDRKDDSFFDSWPNSGEVVYTVTVPAGTTLRDVKTINGSIRLDGVNGEVNVSSVNGSIDAGGLRNSASIETINGHAKASFAAISKDHHIEIKSVNGRSEIVLPANASCGINARTVHGSISNDFGLENEKSKWGVGNRLNADIGAGGASVDISTVNGGIRVSKAASTM